MTFKNAQGVEYTHSSAVICDHCGIVGLTEEQELSQLEVPDQPWNCPRCGGEAEWDDECPSTNPADEAAA